MNLLELATQRYSLRDFSPKEVEPEKINYLLQVARMAPSAVNRQPWVFVVITQSEGREKLLSAYNRDWFAKAPLYILACADNAISWKRACDNKDHGDIDLAIAIEHICLAATEIGLGSCWVCNFDLKIICENFELPAHITPIAIIPIGYSNNKDKTVAKSRKQIEEIVKWEKY